MKKNTLFIIGLFLTLVNFSFAQSPAGIPYQAVARNNTGAILTYQPIRLRFSIHQSSASGAIQYSETQTAITNGLGLFSINIGQGTPATGTFASITWNIGTKFLQIEMDPMGGTSFSDMGTQQLMSVPYALYANSAGSASGSIAAALYSSGTVNTLTENLNYQFFNPTINATIAAGQKVEVTCSVSIGTTTAGGAIMNQIAVGQKIAAAAAPSDNGADYIVGYRVAQNTRGIITLTTIFSNLAPGTYTFGMIYQLTAGQATTWNYNDWSRTSLMIINP